MRLEELANSKHVVSSMRVSELRGHDRARGKEDAAFLLLCLVPLAASVVVTRTVLPLPLLLTASVWLLIATSVPSASSVPATAASFGIVVASALLSRFPLDEARGGPFLASDGRGLEGRLLPSGR